MFDFKLRLRWYRDTISNIWVPFMDIRTRYSDRPDRRVLDLRLDGLKEIPVLGWCSYSKARPICPFTAILDASRCIIAIAGTSVARLRTKRIPCAAETYWSAYRTRRIARAAIHQIRG